jgi:hypothetical protein
MKAVIGTSCRSAPGRTVYPICEQTSQLWHSISICYFNGIYFNQLHNLSTKLNTVKEISFNRRWYSLSWLKYSPFLSVVNSCINPKYSKSKFSQNTADLLSIKVATCFDSRSHHQANYWIMYEVHQVKVHIFGIPNMCTFTKTDN